MRRQEKKMGTVLRFPVELRKSRNSVPAQPGEEMGRIIILPVIRIERWTDAPPAGTARARKRDAK
jgi:hypothetical protein